MCVQACSKIEITTGASSKVEPVIWFTQSVDANGMLSELIMRFVWIFSTWSLSKCYPTRRGRHFIYEAVWIIFIPSSIPPLNSIYYVYEYKLDEVISQSCPILLFVFQFAFQISKNPKRNVKKKHRRRRQKKPCNAYFK